MNFWTLIHFQILCSLRLPSAFKFPGLDAQSVAKVESFTRIHRCDQVVHNDLPASDSELVNFIASSDIGAKMVLTTNENESTVIGKDIWRTDRTTCALHVIAIPAETSVSTSATLIRRFSVVSRQDFQYFLVLAVACEPRSYPTMSWSDLQHDLDTRGPEVMEALRSTQNWVFLLLFHKFNGFNAMETRAIDIFCNPDHLYCSCAIGKALFIYEDLRTLKSVDYNGWPIYIHGNTELKAVDDWSAMSALPLRSILSTDWRNYRYPVYTICTVVATKLNATLRSLVGTVETDKPATFIMLSAWTGYNPRYAKLMFDVQGVKFVYCKNTNESIGGGDMRILLAPFDAVTWFSIAAVIVSLGGIFKLSRGESNLFHILACLVCQGQIVPGKFVFLWALWIFANVGLTNLYTSFIESVMVAPEAQSYLENFEQLHRANYQLVMGETENMATNVRNGRFRGTWYLNALSASMEFKGKNYWDPEFLRYALQSKKKAFFIASTQSYAIRQAFGEKLPWLDCHVSEAEIAFSLRAWATRNPNAAYIRSLFHRLYSGGILGLFTKARDARWNRLFQLLTQKRLDLTFYQNQTRRAGMMVKHNNDAEHAHTLSTENTQARTIFFTWLIALATALLIFLAERTVAKCTLELHDDEV